MVNGGMIDGVRFFYFYGMFKCVLERVKCEFKKVIWFDIGCWIEFEIGILILRVKGVIWDFGLVNI